MKKRPLLIACGIIFLFLLQTGVFLYVFYKNYAHLENQIANNNDKVEAKITSVTDRIDAVDSIVAEIIPQTENMTTNLDESITAKIKDDQLISILIENIIYENTRRGFAFFYAADYPNAYESFTRTQRYQRNDATIWFYRIYSLYLSTAGELLNEATYQIMYEGIQQLRRYPYLDSQGRGFTDEEMKQKIEEMSFNIEERRKQMLERAS